MKSCFQYPADPQILEAHDFQNLLQKHGAIFFTTAMDLDEFKSISDGFTTRFISFEAEEIGRIGALGANFGRSPLPGYPSIFLATGRNNRYELPFHGEGYFHLKTPPQMLWFYCQQPANLGGETWLCDGELLFEHFPPKIQAFCLEEQLLYHRYHPADVWPQLYGTTDPAALIAHFKTRGIQAQFDSAGGVQTQFYTPLVTQHRKRPCFINNLLPFALRELEKPGETQACVRLKNGEAIPSEIVYQIRDLAESLRMAVSWQAGYFCVIDNTRVMHGRDRLVDLERVLYLRMGFADFLP